MTLNISANTWRGIGAGSAIAAVIAGAFGFSSMSLVPSLLVAIYAQLCAIDAKLRG